MIQFLKLAAGVFVIGLMLFISCKKEKEEGSNPPPPSATNDNTCGENHPVINAQLIPVGNLSQDRAGVSVASAGNKILFAGGLTASGSNSSRVDIYDLATQTWSKAELSEARYDVSAIGTGNRIFFAGGEIGDGTSPVSTVDIYDVSANQWSASSLSIAGSGMAPAVAGNKVLFAGGYEGSGGSWKRTTAVDIYDLTTNTWSAASLSTVRRGSLAVATVNNKVYFSGGESWPANPVPGSWFAAKTIDIYNNATNTWSASSLAEGRIGHAGIAVGDKIFWAGGHTGSFPTIPSCSVEIHNINTGNVTIQKLSHPGSRTAVIKNNQIIFYSGTDKFDVFDMATGKWSIGVLAVALKYASIISVNNTIYLAGGQLNGVVSDKVWKLEF